jgi:opacity protein-like surface antigen
MRRALLLATLGLALSVFLATHALAQYRTPPRQPYKHGYEFSSYLTFNQFESKTDLDDEVGVGVRFGYLYTPHHEIEFLLNGVSTNDSFVTSDNVDITDFQVAYVYNFTKKDVVPYLTIGVGFVHTEDDFLGSESDGALGLGGGVRFFLGKAFYARVEYRANFFKGQGDVYLDNEDFTNTQFAFGVGWRLGAP